MLLHEELEIEEAALEGGLCICVPVSVWLEEGQSEAEITAYGNVWDICEEYEKYFSDDLFGVAAKGFLMEKIAPIVKNLGYEIDVKSFGAILEYKIAETNETVEKYSGGAMIVRSADEVKDYACPLLHKPDPDDENEAYACAVVICDGAVVAIAGVNDFFTDDTHEIFVETAKDYRGRDFGTAAVAKLTEHLTGLGLTVGYKCGEGNAASAAIAEKLGMTLSGRRMDLVCYAE